MIIRLLNLIIFTNWLISITENNPFFINLTYIFHLSQLNGRNSYQEYISILDLGIKFLCWRLLESLVTCWWRERTRCCSASYHRQCPSPPGPSSRPGPSPPRRAEPVLAVSKPAWRSLDKLGFSLVFRPAQYQPLQYIYLRQNHKYWRRNGAWCP